MAITPLSRAMSSGTSSSSGRDAHLDLVAGCFSDEWQSVYARDDRPWCGPDPPAAVYLYSPDRRAERPASHLAQFTGVLQVDGYPGFERLPTTCACRKPKSGRIADAARQQGRATRCV